MYCIIFRRNRSCSASDSAYSYTFLRSAVCLSVVCHIRAPWLNRSTDFHATWQVRLWGPVAHCVREWEIRGLNSQPNHQSYAATWRIQTRCWVDGDFAVCQITLLCLLVAWLWWDRASGRRVVVRRLMMCWRGWLLVTARSPASSHTDTATSASFATSGSQTAPRFTYLFIIQFIQTLSRSL